MPGISFIYDLKGGLRSESSLIGQAMESLIHDERYERHEWLNDDCHYLGYTAYGEYPIKSFDLGDVVIYLEGRCYGRNPMVDEKALYELRDLGLAVDPGARGQLVDWLRKADGDFVAILFHKETKDIFIINDIFGRLPLYYRQTPRRFILSRELRFITDFMDLKRFDRMALAQHLLIGYPLGKRTLLENVYRLPPATSIRIGKSPSRIIIDQLYRFNCELKADSRRSVKDNAAELAVLFSQACAARAAPNGKNVISLSGGFDSRAIASCFHRVGISFCAATFLDFTGRAAPDVPIARQVAGLFQAEWELLTLEPPPARDVLKLLRVKNGMNPLYMSFLLAFLDRIRRSWGSDVVFVSGEIGDRLLPDRRPSVDFAGIAELVDHLISQEPKLPFDTVAALTGLKPAEILGELHDHISSYPERDWTKKYTHFVTYERIFKWLTEGEDRNRCYFWSATPYSAFEFANFAVRCPDEQKSYYGLYREFLLQLSPAAAAIEHAGTGAAVISNRFKLKRKALAFLQGDSDLRRRLEAVMGPRQGYDPEPMTIKWLRQQIHCDAIFEYLSAPVLRSIVNHYTNYTKESIDLLFTITATIEERLTGKSVLEERGGLVGASDGR
jgi:asparagine synthase (glutamine-hydrolysing)